MVKPNIKTASYYNIGQLRVDYWNKLKIATAELARSDKGTANEALYIHQTETILKDLKTVAAYFATPGAERIQKLERSLSSHEFTSLANLVSETTKQLVGDSYKSHHDFLNYDELSIESS
ncbi:MAG: hypothetical protein WAU01_15800, partial [Saprospiraceae bacterium]